MFTSTSPLLELRPITTRLWRTMYSNSLPSNLAMGVPFLSGDQGTRCGDVGADFCRASRAQACWSGPLTGADMVCNLRAGEDGDTARHTGRVRTTTHQHPQCSANTTKHQPHRVYIPMFVNKYPWALFSHTHRSQPWLKIWIYSINSWRNHWYKREQPFVLINTLPPASYGTQCSPFLYKETVLFSRRIRAHYYNNKIWGNFFSWL